VINRLPHRLPSAFTLLALVAALGACAEAPRATPATTTFAQATEAAAPTYVIGPGDGLGIFVYRQPDLSADVPVRPDGRISLPLVPDIVAAGRTPTELASDIERRLTEYVRDPTVTVMVRSFVGPPARQIRVIGEAANPLAIPYREGMTLLDVLISAQGLTRFAAGNRAEVIRREPGQPPQVIRVRLNDLLRNGDISQDMPMRPGDTLVIPQSWF
jgi:polysaccharide export outer membrane protein